MKNKKNISFYILLSLIFCISYIVLAIKPLGTEHQFSPEWKIDVTNPSTVKPEEDSKLLPFKLGQTLGYFTPDGKVITFVSFPMKASISSKFYTYYNTNNTEASYFMPDGQLCGKISITGFPMIDDDRIFVFLPGGSSFVACDNNGKRKWDYGGTTPITAFDSSKNGVVVGFADGNICEFSLNGKLIQRFSPGGSIVPVILGTAVSNSGDYIATISGQNKQRFVLAKKDGSQTKITCHEFLPSSTAIQKLVKFSQDDSTVFFTSQNILGITNVKTGKIKHLKINGQAISIQETGDTVFILTKDNSKYTVYAVENFSTLIGFFSFTAEHAFILADSNRLYVGKDSTISCLSITKK